MGIISAIRGTAAKPVDDIDAYESAKSQIHGLASAAMEAAARSDNLEEAIAELELAIEDRGWKQLQGLPSDFQFSRGALDNIIRMSRLYYLKNPLIKRAVDLQTYYVWGQGVTIRGETALDEVVQNFILDQSNQGSLSGHQAMMRNERTLAIDGNLFFDFFTDANTGRVQVRTVCVDEIRTIVRNPDDFSDVWYYERRWNRSDVDPDTGTSVTTPMVAYYPDWRYARRLNIEHARNLADGIAEDDVQMETYAGQRIAWESPLMHIKTGNTAEMDFGVPEVYAALDWARAYKEALEDYKKIIKSLSKWAWNLKTGGNRAMVDAAVTKLNSTLGSTTDGYYDETNPAPVGGSVFVSGGATDLSAIDVSNAVVDPEGFRRLMMMACSALGIPESFMGDAAVGAAATAKTLDRPTELKFRDRQTLWKGVFVDVLLIALEAAARAAGNDLVHVGGIRPGSDRMKFVGKGGAVLDGFVTIDFPSILQRDVQEQVQALVTGVTMNGQPLQLMNDGPTLVRVLATALGMDDVDDIVQLFYPSDDSEPKAKPLPPLQKMDLGPDVMHSAGSQEDGNAQPAPNEQARPGKTPPAAGDKKAGQSEAALARALTDLTSFLVTKETT